MALTRTALLPLLLLVASVGVAAEASLAAQQIYAASCSGCHGPKGEGGRGARLATPRLVHASDQEALVTVITRGVPGTEMVAARLEPDQIRTVASLIWEWTQAPMPQAIGNVERGATLYKSVGQCEICHAIRGQGGVIGPDLTEIGIKRGADYLKRALVDPQADLFENFTQYRWFTPIPDNFLWVQATTKRGAVIGGARVNEDVFSILVRDATGKIHSLNKAELKELRKEPRNSPMPSYRSLSADDLTDIVAYLSSLRGNR